MQPAPAFFPLISSILSFSRISFSPVQIKMEPNSSRLSHVQPAPLPFTSSFSLWFLAPEPPLEVLAWEALGYSEDNFCAEPMLSRQTQPRWGFGPRSVRLVTHQAFIPLSVRNCNIWGTCGRSCELQRKHRQARFGTGR